MEIKKNDYEKTLKMAEEFKVEAEIKKQEKFQKNKNHIKLLNEQVKQVPRTFAKTGIAVIKS
jgi:hypothetical protein